MPKVLFRHTFDQPHRISSRRVCDKSLWQRLIGKTLEAANLSAVEQIACSLCLGSFIYIRQLEKGLTLDNF